MAFNRDTIRGPVIVAVCENVILRELKFWKILIHSVKKHFKFSNSSRGLVKYSLFPTEKNI